MKNTQLFKGWKYDQLWHWMQYYIMIDCVIMTPN